MLRKPDLDYLRLNWFLKAAYNVGYFFASIPLKLWHLCLGIWGAIKKLGIAIKDEAVDIYTTFVKGSWQTKLSFLIMGFGSICRGQILRGILFFLFEGVFITYIAIWGCHWLEKLPTLGTELRVREYNEALDTYVYADGDNSFKILLYSILTIFFILAFIYTWRLNVRQNRIVEQIIASGRTLRSNKDDMKSLLDNQFHKTLLALPLAGIIFFTIMPIIFMILVAFTNFDGSHDGYANLFTWIGADNFNTLFSSASGGLLHTFGEILSWTLMWAFFATFSNYFLGMFVAMMINKKGIKFKKVWRGILVLTIAIPQFVSLLYVSKMFNYNGIVNGWLTDLGLITENIKFWNSDNPWVPRILVILINIWVGIPYLMLVATGILMNIPQDLYESAKVEGANAFQQYTRITLPYMLFVTGPYLLTSFIGNLNNFNVIYLLTYGQVPVSTTLSNTEGSATSVDLLITWLFKITMQETSNYKLAAVISIMVFVVVAVLSLVVYNVIPSTRNEEDYLG